MPFLHFAGNAPKFQISSRNPFCLIPSLRLFSSHPSQDLILHDMSLKTYGYCYFYVVFWKKGCDVEYNYTLMTL